MLRIVEPYIAYGFVLIFLYSFLESGLTFRLSLSSFIRSFPQLPQPEDRQGARVQAWIR